MLRDRPDSLPALPEDEAERHLVAQRMARNFAAMRAAEDKADGLTVAAIVAGACAVLIALGIGWAVTSWFTALNAAAIAGAW